MQKPNNLHKVRAVKPTKWPIEMEIPSFGICIAESHHERDFEMQPTICENLKIYFILEGEGSCHIGNNCLEIEKGNLLIIPKSIAHYLTDNTEKPLSLYILIVDEFAMSNHEAFINQFNILDTLTRQNIKPLQAHDYMAFEIPRMLKKVLYEQHQKPMGYVPSMQASLINIVVALNRIYKHIPVAVENDSDNETLVRIQQVANYISSNFYESITVENVARMACLSVRQFSNQFKASHGVTFMQYLHFQRVQFAQKLLLQTDKQIASICFESGFNDLAHFYRVFKKQTGMSPRKYRLYAAATETNNTAIKAE